MPVHYEDGKIYTIVNDFNDEIYVGSTAQPYLCSRMSSHRQSSRYGKTSPLYAAMRLHGADHFRIVLHHAFPCASKDELGAEENKVIDAFIAAGKTIYNRTIGGKLHDETKAKLAEANRGMKRSDETKAKMSKARRAEFGNITLVTRSKALHWVFSWHDDDVRKFKSFSVNKYGDYGAFFRAEEMRRQVFPEWGNAEDIYCDDLGHIDWE